MSAVRSVANVIQVGTSDYKKLVNVNGIASGWVGETAARPATNTSQLAEVAYGHAVRQSASHRMRLTTCSTT